MANQIALRVLTQPGTIVVAGARQHIVAYELGAAGRNAGIQFDPVDDSDGTIRAADVVRARQAADYHQPTTSLVCVENTHMPAGGVPWSLSALRDVREAAGDLPVHMDGARLFNAEIATGVSAAEFADEATTVMSCLSKGLCAPVGSLLAGPVDFIEAAVIERKRLGGAMRQAGVLAAAGLVALQKMVDRLADDHRRARELAEAVAERWPDGGCVPERVVTNIVLFHSRAPGRVLDHLRSEGVLADSIAPGLIRLMTHHDVDDAGIEQAKRAVAGAPH
jgi:threonine aldolase